MNYNTFFALFWKCGAKFSKSIEKRKRIGYN